MKKLIVTMLLAFCLIFSGCGEKTLQKEEITIYHATDMHYLSQQLTDNSPAFIEMIAAGDGKMTHYIEQIMDAFVADVIREKPDYLIVGGDITFNGEKQSHLDFAMKMKEIENAGIQVLVIPGNHDIDYPFCYKYEGEHYSVTDRMTDKDFETVYADYGLKQAYSRDKNSFSYFYRLTDKITLLAIDSNRGGGTGVVNPDTIVWMEEELKKINKDTKVIALTHQTLRDHFEGDTFAASYSIINNAPLIKLFKDYGVILNLSGHIHTQHKYSNDYFTDIATESLAVMPYNYGVITCNNEKIIYKTQPVDVQGWAEKTGQTDENFIDFMNYSKEFYMKNQSGRSLSTLAESGLSEEDIQHMADFFAEMNIYYFSGTIDEAYDYLVQTEGYKKWLEKGENLWHYTYVMGRMEEARSGIDHNSWEKHFSIGE